MSMGVLTGVAKKAKTSGVLDTEMIRSLREKRGLTLEKAAQAAGLGGRQAWHQIESGARTNLELDTLARVAGALGVHSRELLK